MPVERYLGFHQRIAGYFHAAARDSREIPGLDAIAELRRRLQGWDLPAPLPEEE